MQKLHKILIIFGIVLILSGVFYFAFNRALADSSSLEVSFLNVGQGDAILIETPEGQNILIDGGPDKKVIDCLSEEFPFWDRTIDLMILTHPHDDHVRGLIDVLQRYNVKKVLYTGAEDGAAAYNAWKNLIKELAIPLVIIDRPQIVNLGKNCFLDILYPRTSFLGKEEKKDLRADILKIGHHGSNNASSEYFLQIISPKEAVIQVGAENDFGHPTLRILRRLEKMNISIFRNDKDGTVRFVY